MTKTSVSKSERLQVILRRLAQASAVHTSLEAYKLLEKIIDEVEDEFLGEHTYNPPRSLLTDFKGIERMYVTKTESIFAIPKYTGVQILISHRQITFISRYGAIEIQSKLKHDKGGQGIHFEKRRGHVLFQKPDACGDGVWHPKNL